MRKAKNLKSRIVQHLIDFWRNALQKRRTATVAIKSCSCLKRISYRLAPAVQICSFSVHSYPCSMLRHVHYKLTPNKSVNIEKLALGYHTQNIYSENTIYHSNLSSQVSRTSPLSSPLQTALPLFAPAMMARKSLIIPPGPDAKTSVRPRTVDATKS